MREHAALRRAAWRELWPAAIFASVLALGTWAWSIPAQLELRNVSVSWSALPWLPLVLAPAAVYAGLAVGRSPTHVLAFVLARPSPRGRLLLARVEVAWASLVIAIAIVTAPAFIGTPHASMLVELALTTALLGLAFAFAVVAALVTDREPLALGIAALLFAIGPSVMLVSCEALGITPPRVFANHPLGLVAAIGIAIAACIGAAKELWCEQLPLRARKPIERVMVRASAGWIAAHLLCWILAWRSSAADAGVPMVILGDGLVAIGSPGGRIDAVLGADGAVLMDATAHGDDITRAVTDGTRLAVTFADLEGRCRVALVDARHGERRIDRGCDRLLLSPSGATLAIVGREGIVYVDTESATTRSVDHLAEIVVVGWLGEELIVHGRESASDRRLRVGARVLSELPVASARLSPTADRIAMRVVVPRNTLHDEGPARLGILTLRNGELREHDLTLGDAHVVDWLDAEHVAIRGYDRTLRDTSLVVMSADDGELRRVKIPYALPPQRIVGPAAGPWLVDRGTLVEALAPDGAQLWRQSVATLERDDDLSHRWAIVDGNVIGIGQDGTRWQHELPWEAAQ